MDPKQIEEIARQIVDAQLHNNLAYHVALVLLVFIATCIGSFLGAYLKTRGINFATKTDFARLLVQVKRTTTETEDIKRVIGHEDWSLKEYKTLRRTKLEQLLFGLAECRDRLDTARNHRFFDGPAPEGVDPRYHVEALALLYFPELREEIRVWSIAHIKYEKWTLEVLVKLRPLKNTPQASELLQATTAEAPQYYKPVLAGVTTLENRAREIMDEIIRPKALAKADITPAVEAS